MRTFKYFLTVAILLFATNALAVTIVKNHVRENANDQTAYFTVDDGGPAYEFNADIPLSVDVDAYLEANKERFYVEALRTTYPGCPQFSNLADFNAWVAAGAQIIVGYEECPACIAWDACVDACVDARDSCYQACLPNDPDCPTDCQSANDTCVADCGAQPSATPIYQVIAQAPFVSSHPELFSSGGAARAQMIADAKDLVDNLSYADINNHIDNVFGNLSTAQKNSLKKLYKAVLFLLKK